MGTAPGFARGFDYGTPQRTINAGIINDYGVASTTGAYIAWPYVFEQLNARTDAKPVGWKFVNPTAPHEVNENINLRWGALAPLGWPVTPDMGAYWELPLKTSSESQLRDFQVILLEVNGEPSISAADVEKLRQYVDGGGILWIDADPSASGFTLPYQNGGAYGSFAGWLAASFGSGAGVGASRFTLSTNAATPAILGPYLAPGIPAINSPYDLALGSTFDWMPMQGSPAWTSNIGSDPDQAQHFLFERQCDLNYTTYVAEGHLGAGAVVLTSLGAAATVGYVDATLPAPGIPDLPAADAPVLQFISDIIAQSNSSLSALRNRQAASAAGDAFGTSVMPTWRYTSTSSSGTVNAQAVAYGRFAYVADPSALTLHWFALAPKGNQSSNEVTKGYTPPVVSSGGPVSPPTVWPGFANLDGGTIADPYQGGGSDGFVHVFVEDQAGKVYWVNTATGDAAALPPPAFVGSATMGSGTSFNQGVPPAPYVYDHRLYATQPNGSLYIYDLLPGATGLSASATPGPGPIDYVGYPASGGSGTAGSEQGLGGPVVGIVHDDCNNIVAAYSTNLGLYTVFTGARGEKLLDAGFDSSGVRMYAPKLTGSSPMNPTNTIGQIDQAVGAGLASPPNPYYRLYWLDQNGVKHTLAAAVDSTGQHFTLAGGASADPGASEVYADYDVDWKNSQLQSGTQTPGALDRIIVAAGSQAYSTSGSGGLAEMISSPVMDKDGNIYAIDNLGTGNSSIYCLRDAYPQANAKVLWRYRLPNANDYNWFVTSAATSNTATGLQDADGRDVSLLGAGLGSGDAYTFVGTPAVDGRGNVYAVATDGTRSAIFCFNSGKAVTADLPVGGTAINPSVQVIQQSVDANHDEFNQTPTLLIGGTNFNAGSTGHITFNNFAQPSGVYLYPFYSEGEPIQVQYTFANGQGTGQAPPNVPFHTNIAWVADLSGVNSTLPTNTPAQGGVGGMAVVGDYLYFTYGAIDSAGSGAISEPHLYRLYTQNGANGPKAVGGSGGSVGYLDMAGQNSAKKPVLQDLGATNVGQVPPMTPDHNSTGDITASSGSLIVTGPGGVVNYQPEMTLVTDKTRLMGLDADGDAMFAVDSTDEVQSTYTANGRPGTSSTHVPLDNPTNVTQLSTDRYLLADRGNNRCVEVDRKGNVMWEVSTFVDLPGVTALIPPSDPHTLNDPTSVEVWRDDFNNVHYLISDSGNYRIVDIVDVYVNGSAAPTHYLDWVSRTGSRNYRYEHAFRYTKSITTTGSTTTTVISVAALVTNKRVGPMNGSSLSPASADSVGGSIVLLNSSFAPLTISLNGGNYSVEAAGPNSGTITDVISYVNLKGSTVLTPLKNPRYLGAYTPDPASMPAAYQAAPDPLRDELLYCDDNGAFDLDPTWTPAVTSPVTPPSAKENWSLNWTIYNALGTPIDASGNTTFSRTGIPFVPSSIQRVGTDIDTTNNTYSGRYLIANPYTQGSVSRQFGVTSPTVTVSPGFGGEVFLISGQTNKILTDRTFSRPSNTSPLSQPNCAVFAK